MEPHIEAQLLRPADAARWLGIGRSKVYELINRGDLQAVVLGPRCTRISRAALEQLVVLRSN